MLLQNENRRGFGASKRRSAEHYKRIAHLSWRDKKLPVTVRFWKLVEKKGLDECWPWTGCTVNGYGRFSVNNKSLIASRLAFEFEAKNSVPPDQCVCHHCDNRLCCNPRHLFIGTRADNSRDMCQKSRQGNRKITELDVIEIRKSILTTSGLARRFKINAGTVWRIKRGKSWNHVT